LRAASGIAAFGVGAGEAFAQNEQFIPRLVYRTGPYAPNGIPFADGYADYVDMVNARYRGVGGVKITYEECEDGYNNDKGVECYERLKGRGAALALVALGALVAKNLVRGRIGRQWMAIRDMDIAAEIIGIRPLRTKLLAFAVSSFYCGIAGAMWAFIYTSAVEASAFEVDRSFQILFMIIIGGLGSILGSFLGAGFIVLLPIFLDFIPRLAGSQLPVNVLTNLESMVFGALIVFFLIVEPRGLARLWQIGKEKLRLWPFPH